jgi:adenosylcobinamide kinase/adenosylcobinamide-phosphate guanylyltransferase
MILGGVRSANRLANGGHTSGLAVVCVATATPGDDGCGRIEEHRRRRPADGDGREPRAPRKPCGCAGKDRCPMIECPHLVAHRFVLHRPQELEQARSVADRSAGSRGALIIVSNETGLGIVPIDALSRFRFTGEAGLLPRPRRDRVTLVAGLPMTLKGDPT